MRAIRIGTLLAACACASALAMGCHRSNAPRDGGRRPHVRPEDLTRRTANDPPRDPGHESEAHLGAPSRHLGEMMAEVGRRLERSGRSVQAGRWELAAYDVGELDEVFEDEIVLVVTPDDVALDVGKVAAVFARAQLPPLEKAIATHDRGAFERAYAQAAEGCNGCHRAAGHGFIEVPTVIGEAIPRMTPVAAP